jgi:hypothetical protein
MPHVSIVGFAHFHTGDQRAAVRFDPQRERLGVRAREKGKVRILVLRVVLDGDELCRANSNKLCQTK